MTKEQHGIKRLLCILLSVCMIIGLMPMIALPARAADDPNTIGALAEGTARYGNGWAWDGSGTLTLFGAKIVEDSYSVFSYDDGDITVELVGYNEVHTAGSTFAEVGGNTVTISGSGILNIDCPLGSDVVVNSGCIDSSSEYLVSTGGLSYLAINGGYVSATGMVEYSRVTMNKGCLDIESIGTNADVTAAGGYLKVNNVAKYGTIKFLNCVVDITGTIDGTVTAESSNCVLICPTQASGSVSVGMLGQTATSNGRNIYCNEFVDSASAATEIDAPKAGVFCRNPVNIVDGGSFSGGNYFEMPSGSYAITASGTGSAITASDTTIVTSGGNGISLDNAKFGANNTVVAANGGITLKNASTGTGSALIAKDASVNITDGSVVDDGAYIYSNCSAASSLNFTLVETAYLTIRNAAANAVTIDSTSVINGSLTYASEGGSLTIPQDVELGSYSKIAAYSKAGCKIFDADKNIPTHTFYYAEDIGSEFKTTTDTSFAAHTANAVYYGKELQPRFEADEYADGNSTVSSDTALSAAAEDSARVAQFVISSSSRIPTPATFLTGSLITPYGQTSEGVKFDYVNVNGSDKRILVTMTLESAVIPGDYTVRVENSNNGMTCEFPITLTSAGDTPMMDFTAGADAWSYKNRTDETANFTGKDTDVTDATTWQWYGTAENAMGYEQYTLVLNGFNGVCDHPIKLPAGSTIILKEYNTLTTKGDGILCEGGNLTITRDDDMTGYLILKSGENGAAASAINVPNGFLTIDGVTVEISVEGTKLETCTVYADNAFVIHDAIITLNNMDAASFEAIYTGNMFLGGTSTLTAQAAKFVVSSEFWSARATSIDNVSGSSTATTLEEYNNACMGDSAIHGIQCTDRSKPLVIKTRGLEADKTTVHLPANTGVNTWDILNKYLTIKYGSGNFVLSDKDNALDTLRSAEGVTAIALNNGTITAEFTNDFAGGEDNAITLYLNEYNDGLRGDDVPIKVIFDRYYTVDVNITGSGSGSVTFAYGYTSDKVVSGGSIAFDIIPVAGNKIISITYNGEDFTDQFDKYRGGTLTLADITSDGTLNVEFGPLETFKLVVDGNFEDPSILTCTTDVSPDAQGGFTEGTEITATLTPEPDWEITSVKLNGVKLTLTADNKCTFTITENSTLYVEMEYLIKTVTVNKTGEGTATSAAATVTKGGDVEFTVIPADGWRIGSAKLNNVDVKAEIGADGRLTVTNVTEDITLDVLFVEISKCALDVTIPHGSYTADPAGLSYKAGTEVTVTLTPELNWAITAVTLNGTALTLTADNKYTFTITEDSELVAEMENLIKTVTVNQTGEGIATQSNESVLKGDDVSFTVIPANGWRLKSAELNGVDVTAQIDEEGALMVRNVTENITLNVVFVEVSKCALDVTIPHGSYTAAPAGLSYKAGTEVTVTLTPETDWAITAVTLNGKALALTEDNKYTFTITEDSKLVAETEYLIKTVTVNCGKGGKVDPMTTQVRKGGQATFTITPDSGYSISSVRLDGARQTVENGKVTVTVTKDCTLAVTFSKNGGSSGGKVNPSQGHGSNSGNSSSNNDSTQPSLSTDSSVKGWDAIKEKISQTVNGRVEIALNGAASVPADVIEAAKGKNITLVLRIDSTKSLEIDASTIKTAAAMNVGVKTGGTLPENILAQIKGTALPLNADVNLCGDAALVINVGRENAGKIVTLMLIKDGRAVGVSAAKAAADGTVRVELPEGGSYALAISGASQLLGDVNGDMSVTIKDALALLKYVMSVEKLEADAVERGDVRATGKPDISDARRILRYSFGLDKLV